MAPQERGSTLFTFTTNHLAALESGNGKHSGGAKKTRVFLSIATVAAAGFSGAVIAAPAHASVSTANGGNELQMGPAGAPYSEEEIRSLQERGDFLGASSRITANQYALGHMY